MWTEHVGCNCDGIKGVMALSTTIGLSLGDMRYLMPIFVYICHLTHANRFGRHHGIEVSWTP